MAKTPEINYSTYSRAILTELESLSSLIRKYSLTQRGNLKQVRELTPLLSLIQIKVALTNPQNSLKPSMHAYATMLKIHRDIIGLRDQVLLQKRMAKEGMEELREKYALAATETQKEELSQAMIELENSSMRIQKLQKTVSELEQLLEVHKNKVDELIRECDKQWNIFRNHYLKALNKELSAANMELTAIESKELHEPETWPELLHRFKELNIPVPSALEVAEPSYDTYFKLKAYLAVHASLSRRMLPHSENDILKIVKPLLKG